MKVLIYDVSLLFGAEGDQTVKIEYEAIDDVLVITGRLLVPVAPHEKWAAGEVEKVIRADLKNKADAITAVRAVVAQYKGQEIDIENVFEVEDNDASKKHNS